jgi:hypothetical protein
MAEATPASAIEQKSTTDYHFRSKIILVQVIDNLLAAWKGGTKYSNKKLSGIQAEPRSLPLLGLP